MRILTRIGISGARPDIAAKCLFAVLLALSLCPALLVPIPAMVDYPNHLARMFILSRDGTPAASPFYQVTWSLYPNLAMDLLVPRIARFMSVEDATRLFYLVSQLLIVSGSVAIEYVVKRRFHIAGFVALMFLYSLPFAWGFVNFEFGLGVALWGIACWLSLRERGWMVRCAAHAVFVALLFTAHFFALGIYGVTVGLHEVWTAWSRRASIRSMLATFLLLALPAAMLLALMTFYGGSVGGAGTDWLPQHKLRWLISVLNGYSIALSAVGVGGVVALSYGLARHGALRFEQAGALLAVGFGLLYLAMPFRLLDTAFVDVRVIVASALILPAFLTVTFPNLRWRLGTAAFVTTVTLANLALTSAVWISYRAEYDAVIASFQRMERGSLVLVGHSGDGQDPPEDLLEYPIYHAPTLAVHFADAFVPSLFTSRGKQPVTARPAYRHLDIPQGGPVPAALLRAIAEGRAGNSVAAARIPPFIRTWQLDFDYLYMLGARAPNPLPDILEEVDAGSRFVMYRIRK